MRYKGGVVVFLLILTISALFFTLRGSAATGNNKRAEVKGAGVMNSVKAKDPTYKAKEGLKVIYLAGGCFWGLEKYMENIPGVIDAVSGYANGKTERKVSYEEVCTGATGCRETVRVVYDPKKVFLETLLFAFFRVIDVAAENRQGNDVGTQYQAAVFYPDTESREVAEKVFAIEKSRAPEGFYVLLEPLKIFHEAEEYHQNYLTKHPGGYCHISPAELAEAKQLVTEAKKYPKPSDAELKHRLTGLQYEVTQHSATEPPHENEFWNNSRKGIYVDIATGEPLFASTDKYDSSCGWPAFTKPVDENTLVHIEDSSYGMRRTEVRSRTGNSHLGHVFEGDRESPNGVRYCINSASLRFIPYEAMEKEGYGKYMKYVEKPAL